MSNVKKLTNPKRPPSELAKRIQHYMKQRDFSSIAEFERQARVPKDVVRRLIGGFAMKTTAENVAKIARTLGVPLSDLISESGNIGISALNIAPEAKNPQWESVKSDEMHPTFKSGDYVLVDAGINEIQGSGIYLIKMKDAKVTFRRVDVNSITGKLYVRSDNDKYRAEGECEPKNVNIAGKVIGVYTAI